MTDTVRIADLATPTFPPHVLGQRAEMEAMAELIPWSASEVIDVARMQTGATDVGDAGFVDRLQTVLDHYAATDPSGPGRVALFGGLLGFAKGRLLIEQELARNPAIRDVVVEPPIIIAGLPRTGTTHLHNAISADPGLRYLPYWEAVEPLLPDNERLTGGVDPRWERTETVLQMLNESMPYFKRMHHMTTWHAHEEINLLAYDMSSMLLECMALSPGLRDWYKGRDQTEHYRYMRTIMQVLQSARPGPARWVLKSPQNLEQIAPILEVFPGATLVFTHRDPVSITASTVTMQAYLLRTVYDEIDLAAAGRYWADRVEDLFLACVRDRSLATRAVDIRFDDFMADQEGTLRRIYDVAGQPVTGDSVRAWQTYLRDHPAARHGKVRYELQPFGIDPADVQAALKPYTERFL